MDDDRSTPPARPAPGSPEPGAREANPPPAGRVPRLLTPRYETLGLADRAAALLEAREAGKGAALEAESSEELESGPASAYYRHVVGPAREAGALDEDAAADWRKALEEGKALRDPRVQAFLFGWHERGVEILGNLAAGGEDEPERVRWFLKGMKP